MSLEVSGELLRHTKHADLADERKNVTRYASRSEEDRNFELNVSRLSNEALNDLSQAAAKVKDGKTARATDAILQARSGKFNKTVPSFKAFQGMLEAFLHHEMTDGWIYVEARDGRHYPELVTSIYYDSGSARRSDATPTVRIDTAYYGYDKARDKSIGLARGKHTFSPGEVANRTIPDILAASKIYKETEALRTAHDKSTATFEKKIMGAFAKQFRFTGEVYHYADYRRNYLDNMVAVDRKVVHDLPVSELGPISTHVESDLFDSNGDKAGLGTLPHHPVIRVFDLKTHEFYWVHSDALTEYVYDKGLRHKLVLPDTHHDLLDVLTTDTDVLTADIIEGKSAGNIILGKGIPGVGKTLTAEVYSELVERPLYSVHSGTLGTTAEAIEKSLNTVFLRAKRWNCVLLMDEADVFVMTRGDDIELNAIVAEFLRTLEYFDGLMFMTTNRPDDIDEAIVSRCAAIIEYTPPNREHAAEIWKVMATQFKVHLPDELIEELLDLFPQIAPRDIKMLFRLALRVIARRKLPLNLDVFRQCAMFRAVKMSDAKKKK